VVFQQAAKWYYVKVGLKKPPRKTFCGIKQDKIKTATGLPAAVSMDI